MPQWFLPYTAAALVAAALGWLALNYNPDAGSPTAKPALAGAPGPASPGPGAPAPAPTPAPPQPNSQQPGPAASAPAAPAVPAAVRTVVTEAMTTDRAADCTRLYTQAFLEQMAGTVGPEAVAQCRDNSDGEPDSHSLRFRSIARSGNGYTVAVSLLGGQMAGSKVKVSVTDAGGWKVDRLLDVDIDINRLAAAAAAKAKEEGASDADASCLESRIAATSADAYERAVIEGRSDEYVRSISADTVSCLSAATLRRQIASGIRAGAGDAPDALVECVIDKILAGKSAAELRELVKMGSGAGMQLGRQAGIECAQMLGVAS